MNITELKLRAWDKWNECYLYSDKHKTLSAFFLMCEGLINGGNELVYERFTGLKGKNEKDIYEGDIVKETISHKKQLIYTIRFGEYETYAHYHIGFYYVEDNEPFAGRTGSTEVIGNINENKDLLN